MLTNWTQWKWTWEKKVRVKTFSAATSWLFCFTGLSGVWGQGQLWQGILAKVLQTNQAIVLKGVSNYLMMPTILTTKYWWRRSHHLRTRTGRAKLPSAEEEEQGGQQHQDHRQEGGHHHNLAEGMWGFWGPVERSEILRTSWMLTRVGKTSWGSRRILSSSEPREFVTVQP